MKQFLILIILFRFLSSSGQSSIDWKNLVGNWKVEKAINITNGDTASPWFPEKTIIYSYGPGSRFIDKTSTDNTMFEGNYIIDKAKNKVSFSNIIQTTKFPNSSLKDYIAPTTRDEFIVEKLNADVFVYYYIGCDLEDVGTICKSYTYLRKVK